MTNPTTEAAQRHAARVAGYAYLFTNILAIVSAFTISSRFFVPGDPAATAAHIIAADRLFRISIAIDILVFAADVPLVVALYVILKPVDRGLALVAFSWRLIETAILLVMTLHNFDVIQSLSDALDRGVDANRIQAAWFAMKAHDSAWLVAFIFFGLGSTMFCWLFFKSGYIPKALAAWGIFASVLIAACNFAFIVFPTLAHKLEPACYLPILTFEVLTGLWLTIKGLKLPSPPVTP